MLLLLLLSLLSIPLHAQQALPEHDARSACETAQPALRDLPLLFRDAADPQNPRLLYRADGARGRVGFLRDGISLAFREGEEEMVVGLEFEYSNSDCRVTATGGRAEGGHIYSFTGSQRDATIIRHYTDVLYSGVYDGIDIRYYAHEGELKYDCLLQPGADPSLIRMRYTGVRSVEIDGSGDLQIVTSWGRLRERHPYVYQQIDGTRRQVAASFRLIDETSFGFEITGEYDRTLPLVIDPMILAWSTFVGGEGDGYIRDMVLDGDGNIYATGWYNSSFPTTPGVYSRGFNGGPRDCYVFKLSSDGGTLLFSTHIGGNANDGGSSIALGPDSTIYIGGQTESDNFPTTPGAFDRNLSGSYDCFVLRLSPGGDRILYSTLFGGEGLDTLMRIALSPDGSVTATGATSSVGFPTTEGAYDRSLSVNGSASDLFVTRVSPDGSELLFSTFIGGSFGDYGADLVVDSDGETVVTGQTISEDFPTTEGAYQRNHSGEFTEDAFLLRLSADGRELRYSTLFGGSRHDAANAVALAPGGRAIIVGYSYSVDLPLSANAFDRFHAAGKDGFIAIFDNNGSRLVASTLLGSGSSDDELQDIALDSDGSIIVAGRTESSNAIPTGCAVGASSRGRPGTADVYVARISADLSTLSFADYFAGTGNDYGTRISLGGDPCSRELVIALTSHSPDFPTTGGAFQEVKLNGGDDQPVVLKIRPTISPAFDTQVDCRSVSFTDITQGECVWGDPVWQPTTWLWQFGDGTTSSERNPMHTYRQGGTYRVVLTVGCPRDSVVQMISVEDRQPMIASMDTAAVVEPGDTVAVPLVLDALGGMVAITSIRISLHYDISTVRLVNASALAADSLLFESLLEAWEMTIETDLPGRFAARFDAPSGVAGITGGGRLLYPRFLTYVRPNPTPSTPWRDTTTISLDIVAGTDSCGQALTEPGMIRLELCGFSTRLFEMSGSKYALDIASPNPFATSTRIGYSLGLDGPAHLTLHDLSGNHVTTLIDQHLDAGSYSLLWNPTDLPAGTYYIRLQSGDWSGTKMVMVAR